jgi:hypothetical protein
MYDNETRNQFIELRAEGLSLDAISSRLNVHRATLGRWHHESVEQIQRLRALQWHLLEEQIGERLEDTLTRIARRIRKCEDELDTRDHRYRKAVELVRIIRDSRREYLQLRALLLAPLQPTRGRGACLASLDPHKRDKTRQTPDALDTRPLPTNHLPQPEQATSHSDEVAADVRRQVTSPEPSANGDPSSANAVRDPATDQSKIDSPSSASPRLCGDPPDIQPLINTPLQRGEPAQPLVNTTASAVSPIPSAVESSDAITASDGSTALPLPWAAETQSLGENEDPKLGWGEGQTGPFSSSFPEDQSEIQNPQSKIDSPSSASSRLGGGSQPKKHKPYWLNGHYYENPEYPENIARAICARRAA